MSIPESDDAMATSEELHRAIKAGDVDRVTQLLESGADINQLYGMQGTPLCTAIAAHQPDVLQVLLEHGCDVNTSDFDDEPPLYLATRKGHVDCVEALLQTGRCNINKIDHVSGRSPLCCAVLAGSLPVVELLVKAGCDLNTTDRGHNTPLHHALKRNHVKIADVLLKAGHDLDVCDSNGMFPLHVAVSSDSETSLKLILDYLPRIDINQQSKFTQDTAVHLACRKNNVAGLKLLLKSGASVNMENNYQQTPLFLACFDNNVELTRLLLEHRAKPNFLCQQDMKLQVASRKTRSRGKLCKVSPLHIAVLHNNLELVSLLIKHGANLLYNDSRGQNPLYYALEDSDPYLTEFLLDSVKSDSEEITKQDFSGQNLLFAAILCHPQSGVHFMERLIDFGCSVNQRDLQGRPLLHSLTYRSGNNVRLAETLLDNGALINATSDFGFSILHVCVWEDSGMPAVAPLYVLYGANMALRNEEGETPFQMALEDGNAEFATFLVNCGYNCSTESIVNSDDIEDLSVIFSALGTPFIKWIFQQAHNPIDLRTLCRKQITESFAQNEINPKKMRQLPLPDKVIDYVMLNLEAVLKKD